MTDHGATNDDTVVVAEIGTALRRAGIHASAVQIAALADPRRRMRDGLEALRSRLDPAIEPPLTFSAANVQSPGSTDGD